MSSLNENRALTKYMHFLNAPKYVIIMTTKYVKLTRSMMFLLCRQRSGGCWTRLTKNNIWGRM